jgi:hypothetical protein
MAHADKNKLQILATVIKAQEHLMDEVHVCVITDIKDEQYFAEIYAAIPPVNDRFKVEIFNKDCDNLPSPWLLTWVHKQLMLERFADESYTHFMCIEDDMEVTKANVNYWLAGRVKLRSYGIFPSFLRVEWNAESKDWAMVESVFGDQFSISRSPKVKTEDGSDYINLGRTYQGMFFYDRELMREHVDSETFDINKYVPDWRIRIQNIEWPLGVTEAAVMALTNVNVPQGCYSRNFIQYHGKFLMVDPSCLVHHLPNKYTNMQGSSQGKVLLKEMLCQ